MRYCIVTCDIDTLIEEHAYITPSISKWCLETAETNNYFTAEARVQTVRDFFDGSVFHLETVALQLLII